MSTVFAARITSLRKERGMSQKEVALNLGVSQALLSHYEKGVRECGLDFVLKCAEFYNVTTDYLLGRQNSKYGLRHYYHECVQEIVPHSVWRHGLPCSFIN